MASLALRVSFQTLTTRNPTLTTPNRTRGVTMMSASGGGGGGGGGGGNAEDKARPWDVSARNRFWECAQLVNRTEFMILKHQARLGELNRRIIVFERLEKFVERKMGVYMVYQFHLDPLGIKSPKISKALTSLFQFKETMKKQLDEAIKSAAEARKLLYDATVSTHEYSILVHDKIRMMQSYGHNDYILLGGLFMSPEDEDQKEEE